MGNVMNPDGTHKVIAGYSHAAGLQERDQRIAELKETIKWYESAVEEGGGYFGSLAKANKELEAENKELRNDIEAHNRWCKNIHGGSLWDDLSPEDFIIFIETPKEGSSDA